MATSAPTHADVPARPDSVLQGLIDEAIALNPQLVAAQQLEQAAAARPVQAGSRPGPMVGLFYQNDGVAPSLGSEPMTMLGVSAGQEIPYPGKLGLRRQVAQADAELAAFAVQRVRLSLVASVKRAYYGLVLARGLAALALEHRKVWDEVRETARVRYASAVGSQQEMLRAQVEGTRLNAVHAQHHAEARARLAEINSLLGRPPDTPIETPTVLTIALDSRTPEEIVSAAEAASPELRAAEQAIARDQRALDLARLEFKPDFNVEGAAINRGGLPPMWQVSAKVMLPSRARARGAVAEAQARLAASNAHVQDVRLRLRSAVEQRLALLDAAAAIESTYREGLLPQGETAVQSATATYAAGQGSQIAVLDAAAAVLEDRTDYLRVVAAHATEMTRLEEASL
ncbi:MAG TPA: TolC family protein, partial [Vicinamibacteria bacterium]|nr:TolC family protein [Vicinamibacteria bacterium]